MFEKQLFAMLTDSKRTSSWCAQPLITCPNPGVSGEMETVESTWRGEVREGDFVRRTSWGRVVYEHCRLGRRTAFSIDQNISCPSHLAYESHDKA